MGFYYVKNESDAIFSMKITPKLSGVEIIGRPWSTGEALTLSVAPGENDILVYRRFAGAS